MIKKQKRSNSVGLLGMVVGAFLLVGCAETQLAVHTLKQTGVGQSPQGSYKVGKPYTIKGIKYYPAEDYSYDEVGIASWYGPNFHGKKTANGEIYNQYGMTAAHKTLPLPSIVRVTNLENGRSVKLRVNDRGPYHDGRIIDLSGTAAEMLDVKSKGTAKVRVQILPDESYSHALLAGRKGAPPAGYVPGKEVEDVQIAQVNTVAADVVDNVNFNSIATTTVSSGWDAGATRTLEEITKSLITEASDVAKNTTRSAFEGAPTPAAAPVVSTVSYQPAVTTNSVTAQTLSEPIFEPAKTSPEIEQQALQNLNKIDPLLGEAVPQNGQNIAVSIPRTYIQVGAFGDLSNAQRLQQSLKHTGNVSISSISSGENLIHRVRVGPFETQTDANSTLAQIQNSGLGDARFVYDE